MKQLLPLLLLSSLMFSACQTASPQSSWTVDDVYVEFEQGELDAMENGEFGLMNSCKIFDAATDELLTDIVKPGGGFGDCEVVGLVGADLFVTWSEAWLQTVPDYYFLEALNLDTLELVALPEACEDPVKFAEREENVLYCQRFSGEAAEFFALNLKTGREREIPLPEEVSKVGEVEEMEDVGFILIGSSDPFYFDERYLAFSAYEGKPSIFVEDLNWSMENLVLPEPGTMEYEREDDEGNVMQCMYTIFEADEWCRAQN